MGLSRRGLALGAIGLAALGLWGRARSQRARWWSRVERLCACHEPTLARMAALQEIAPGGLDRVLAAQRRSLAGECDDLRVAMARRAALQDVAGAPLPVEPTEAHRAAQRDVARALGLMCGDEHRVFWTGLRDRVARDQAAGAGASPAVLRMATEQLRIRGAMCAGRASLSAPPGPYALTAAEADAQGARCGAR